MKNLQSALESDILAAKKSTEMRTAVMFILGAVAAVGTGFVSIRAIAQDAGSSAVALVSEKQEIIKAELARHIKEEAESRLRVERKLERQDEKMELVLDALRVPQWKRPGLDGGN